MLEFLLMHINSYLLAQNLSGSLCILDMALPHEFGRLLQFQCLPLLQVMNFCSDPLSWSEGKDLGHMALRNNNNHKQWNSFLGITQCQGIGIDDYLK